MEGVMPIRVATTSMLTLINHEDTNVLSWPKHEAHLVLANVSSDEDRLQNSLSQHTV